MSAANPTFTLRVATVRSQNPSGRGGAVFTGIEVNAEGHRIDAKTYYVVKASGKVVPLVVERGQLWQVMGSPAPNTIIVNGYQLTEATIVPDRMELLRPSGEHIVALLADGEEFSGIGRVKARRLWETFGPDLYDVLDQGRVSDLSRVLAPEMSEKLVVSWSLWGDSFTIQWLHSKGFPVSLGRKVVAFFGKDTVAKIEEDPYRLISFAASWKTVDRFAKESFGISAHDPRRLLGGVEEALYSAFDAGHTCLETPEFKRRVKRILGNVAYDSVVESINAGQDRGHFIFRCGFFHAAGPYFMESVVADWITRRLAAPVVLLSPRDLNAVVEQYQSEISHQLGVAFWLNKEQHEAISAANALPFAVITGGAGTGKTMVLRALFRVFEATHHTVYPMALSGRAAKRIREATGYRTTTIAGFLKNFSAEEAPEKGAIVIDEASMVDLPSIYRIIRVIPAHYRLVLVGDQHQLAPVGPGLLLHEVVRADFIPVSELKDVRRYGGAIAVAAACFRRGEWPELGDDPGAEIAFIRCPRENINEIVLRAYDEDRSGSQILSATRHASAGGAQVVNRICQERLNASGEPVRYWSQEFQQPVGTGFRVGDPVICLKNVWDLDLQNGSLGKITSCQKPVSGDGNYGVLGEILWDDGEMRHFTAEFLDNLELAYAITVHKAQGSAFRRVIIPVTKTRLLDRTLLYTAVTRAEEQVLLVGDVDAARAAVLSLQKSEKRCVALRTMLCLKRGCNE